MMYLIGTGCCAVKEITNLSGHRTSRAAMRSFCNKIYVDHYWNIGQKVAPGFVIFTGVVGYTDDKSKPTYGPKFKQFILDNKLGSVTESRTAPNQQNHPTHLVKVWVWTPNEQTLKAWWKRNK